MGRMADQLNRVQAGIEAVDKKVETLDTRVQEVERDMSVVKALVMAPKTPWTAIVGAVIGILGSLVSMATLLIVILDH